MWTDDCSRKPNWLHCHTSFPDKATGNCYVKKIMLTLRIIFHILSECSPPPPSLTFENSCRKKSWERQTFGCFSFLLNGWKMLIGAHVSRKTKGKGGGEGRNVRVRDAGILKREICHFIQPSWEGFLPRLFEEAGNLVVYAVCLSKVWPVVVCSV